MGHGGSLAFWERCGLIGRKRFMRELYAGGGRGSGFIHHLKKRI